MISLMLVSFVIQQDLFVLTSNGADRCESVDCLCEIDLPEETSTPDRLQSVGRFSVYFAEASHELTGADLRIISQKVASFPARGRVIITGHTDGCGSPGFNRELAMLRSRQIEGEIRRLRPDLSIATTFDGEITAQHDEQARRVDVRLDDAPSRGLDLPEYTSDFYLVDSSGSMSSTFPRLMDAIARGMRMSSRVFLSRTVKCKGGSWRSNPPAGSTEIWYSYWKILDLMSPGDELLIISDFDSTVPLSAWERQVIEQKARMRGVKVSSLAVR